MFIHPWDAAVNDTEWREWLATVEHFGVLAVNNLDPALAPLVLPTHFSLRDDEIFVHLARPNPVWPHLEAAAEVRFAVFGDYAFIPSYWRAVPGAPEETGVPTSYYASVQLVCTPTIIDDPQGKADVLTEQLGDFQPEGRHGDMTVDSEPYGRLLSGIRAVRLAIVGVDAKFKYDDNKPEEHRERVNAHLEDRGRRLDHHAAAQQRRRLEAIGDWVATEG